MRAWPALLLFLPLVAAAQMFGSGETYSGLAPWVETKVALPQYPKTENYLPFQVSANTPFSFFVDAKSISIGADGVVRYSLIAKSPDGGLNVSFEGMRCSTKQFRVYAFGRSDKTWSEARRSRWEPMRGVAQQLQRSVLFEDFFCPLGISIATVEEGVQGLRRGNNPLAVPLPY